MLLPAVVVARFSNHAARARLRAVTSRSREEIIVKMMVLVVECFSGKIWDDGGSDLMSSGEGEGA